MLHDIISNGKTIADEEFCRLANSTVWIYVSGDEIPNMQTTLSEVFAILLSHKNLYVVISM